MTGHHCAFIIAQVFVCHCRWVVFVCLFVCEQYSLAQTFMRIVHMYIGAWQSEPHYQHQNPAEWWYKDLKRMVNTVLDHTGTPAYCWLLCLMYVSFIINNVTPRILEVHHYNDAPVWPTTSVLCSALIFMNLSTSLWMIQLFHLKARSIMDIGLGLVRMPVASWLSKFLQMTLSRLYTGQIFTLRVIQQLKSMTWPAQWGLSWNH